ncbi:hypothetical protein LJR098_003353 [Rhizobium sp. LjRoot98]|uniref:hypothetical protein n=1 Tax=Rhizobium sp. LjRoot98 TaxID=3342345 RepID=UPI003ECF41A9
MATIPVEPILAVAIPTQEFGIALLDMDAETKEKAGIANLSLAEIINTITDVGSGLLLIQHLGMTGGYYIKEAANGTKYVIIKGHASLRPYLKGTRYLTENPKVLRVGIGPIGSYAALRSNFIIATTVYAAEDVIKFCYDDDYTLDYLASDLVVQGATTAIAGYAGTLVTNLLFAGAMGTFMGMALPAVGAGLVVGAVVGYLVQNQADELQIQATLAQAMRATANAFNGGWIKPEQPITNPQNRFDSDESRPPRDDPEPREPPDYDDYDWPFWERDDREEPDVDFKGWQGPSSEELERRLNEDGSN